MINCNLPFSNQENFKSLCNKVNNLPSFTAEDLIFYAFDDVSRSISGSSPTLVNRNFDFKAGTYLLEGFFFGRYMGSGQSAATILFDWEDNLSSPIGSTSPMTDNNENAQVVFKKILVLPQDVTNYNIFLGVSFGTDYTFYFCDLKIKKLNSAIIQV